MRNLYAVAYMTEDEDSVKDLYVEILAARDAHEAVGHYESSECGQGRLIMPRR